MKSQTWSSFGCQKKRLEWNHSNPCPQQSDLPETYTGFEGTALLQNGIQIKPFNVDQNVWISLTSLTCILTNFELSTFCHFQDIGVQIQQFSFYISVQFCLYCGKILTFGKLVRIYLNSSYNLQFRRFTSLWQQHRRKHLLRITKMHKTVGPQAQISFFWQHRLKHLKKFTKVTKRQSWLTF